VEISLYDFYHESFIRRPEFEALASLPKLKSLDLTYCLIYDEEAVSPLVGCCSLNNLVGFQCEFLIVVLPVIGMNLVELECGIWGSEEFDLIIAHCPNLEYLDISFDEEDGTVCLY
jgi:hypothetical protein